MADGGNAVSEQLYRIVWRDDTTGLLECSVLVFSEDLVKHVAESLVEQKRNSLHMAGLESDGVYYWPEPVSNNDTEEKAQ